MSVVETRAVGNRREKEGLGLWKGDFEPVRALRCLIRADEKRTRKLLLMYKRALLSEKHAVPPCMYVCRPLRCLLRYTADLHIHVRLFVS